LKVWQDWALAREYDVDIEKYVSNFVMLIINDENKNLTILNLNIRSIANKFDAFKHLLNTLMQPFSIISLTDHETGLMNKTVKLSA
jgi:hypothetical protein